MRTGSRLASRLLGSFFALAVGSVTWATAGTSTPSGTAQVDLALKQSFQFYNLGRYEEAAEQAQDALDRATRLNDESRETFARYSLGLACVQLGEYTVAEKLLSQVLSTAGPPDAYGYLAFGETSLASLYFVELRRLRAQTAAVSALVADKRLLGSVTTPHKDISEFAGLYSKALSGPNAPARDLIALAIIQDVRGDHTDARSLLLRAAQTQRQSVSPPVARMIMHVGAAVELQLGDNATVEKILTALINADEATAGRNSLTVATDLNVLAGLEARSGYFEQAEQNVRRALEIDAHDQNFRIPYITSLNYEAAILLGQGDLHEAEAVLNESLNTRGPDLADNEGYRADARFTLSEIYFNQGRLSEAAQQFTAALKVFEAGGYEQQIPSALLSESRVAGILGKNDLAVKLAKEAVDYMTLVHSQDDPSYLGTLDLLGIAYMRTGDLTDAQRTYEQASEAIAAHPAFGILAFADLNVNYAYVLAEQGRYDTAKQLILETIAREKATSPTPIDALEIAWKTAAWIYDRGGDRAQVDYAYGEALKLGQVAYSRSLAWLSERDRLSYVGAYNDQTAFLYSYCNRRPDAACVSLMYDAMLWQKDMVASGIADVQTRITASKDVVERWRRFFVHEIGPRYVMTSPIMPPFRSAE